MHPFLAGRLRLPLYVGAWLGIAALLSALLVRLEPRPFAEAAVFMGPITLLFGFMCLSAWWVCRALPLGTTSPNRLAVHVFGAALQAGAAWMVLGMLWAALLAGRFDVRTDHHVLVHDRVFLVVTGFVLYLQSVALHYFWLALVTARAAERRLLESHVAAREAELRALRAQLHPHFLFNSLNSISALTTPDPEGARRMCVLLGDFLRTSLALGARERVALAEELSLAERYLAIEGVRFGSRLAFDRKIEPGAADCLVPPLLIQPLVENAVKFGVANQVDGGLVRIEARRRSGTLEIAVENPRDPDAPASRGPGLGLENVRRRLAALDPEAARVDVVSEPERFRVTLTLPAVERTGDVA